MSSISYPNETSTRLLKIAVNFWFTIVVIGQFIFALYIFGLYGISGLNGNFEKWNLASPHGYVEGDLLGTTIFGIHVILAGIITIGGPLQLMKIIRNRFPKFHKINGRIYIIAAFLISFAGLYLSWIKGSVGGLIGSIFITVNALLIMVSAFFTIAAATKRQLIKHRKWAIRLFLCMSGVWFFRVFMMLWLTIHQAPVGFDPDTFQGPAVNMLYTLSYIFPIVFAELYFIAKTKGKTVQNMLSTFLFVLTLCIVIGTFSATMGMWLPNLK